MKPIDFWQKELETCLAGRARMKADQIMAIAVKYRLEAVRTSPANSFKETLEFYGNEDTEKAFATGKAKLANLPKPETKLAKASLFLDGLMELNKTTKIDANPITRLRGTIERINANIGKMDVEIDIPENLMPHQREALEKSRNQDIRQRMPNLAYDEDGYLVKPFVAYCQASTDKPKIKFEIEVRQ